MLCHTEKPSASVSSASNQTDHERTEETSRPEAHNFLEENCGRLFWVKEHLVYTTDLSTKLHHTTNFPLDHSLHHAYGYTTWTTLKSFSTIPNECSFVLFVPSKLKLDLICLSIPMLTKKAARNVCCESLVWVFWGQALGWGSLPCSGCFRSAWMFFQWSHSGS